MLAVSALRSGVKDERHPNNMVTTNCFDECGFPDFSDANALLESIDFDDLFVGMDDGDVLPGLENMDPQLLADFSVSAAGEESSDVNTSPSSHDNTNVLKKEEEDNKSSGSEPEPEPEPESTGGEEVVNNDASVKNGNNSSNSSPKEAQGNKSRKSSSQSKNSHGKRKVKVDWTPELHRRFVQAVEQLGVDKAVPSRILEIMGIDCLTRHNIASHLQKYRSHRKHLLAREAEAASWSQRRQMYGGGGKRPDMNPWPATRPTMGFPPMAPPPPPPPMHHFRPLHVWGHPSMDPSVMHMWPNKHQPPPQQPHPASSWEPPFWRAPTPGTPCFPPPTRFGGPHHVQGIPPHAMYKVDPGGVGPPPRPLCDFQPSKESIDAAIGDVLSKPWLPLPLGLKPPSTDSVMVELQRQGVPKIPPTTTCSSPLH